MPPVWIPFHQQRTRDKVYQGLQNQHLLSRKVFVFCQLFLDPKINVTTWVSAFELPKLSEEVTHTEVLTGLNSSSNIIVSKCAN